MTIAQPLPRTPALPTSLKILAIGNSFSVDAMEYLYQICKSAGVQTVVLGNLYIGGCNIATHLQHAEADDGAYEYRKNTSGTWTVTEHAQFSAALTDEAWDIITMQQSSNTCGVASAHEQALTDLVNIVNAKKTNTNAKLAWHMTWAYQQDSTHPAFPTYNSDQITMYNMTVNVVQNKVMTTNAFDFLIPAGTAIQNARTGFVGDTLTRDGFHLHTTIGRYIAGLSWFAAITGCSVADIAYTPAADVTPLVMLLAKEAVTNAQTTPYAVTNSAYTSDTYLRG